MVDLGRENIGVEVMDYGFEVWSLNVMKER